MKKLLFFLLFSVFIFVTNSFYPINVVLAEYKSNIASGQNIPKLEPSPDDPNLQNGHVYPSWGPVCQRYTYSVIYQDDKNRSPEYVKIYFNGEMIDMQAEDPENQDYLHGVKYIYQYVPNKISSNFYFFEASNGSGKTRSNIIDSPDNGPVLFQNAFNRNEVAVIDVEKQTKLLRYDLKDEWVGGVALSDDGKYLAVKTHKKIYLFDTSKSEPLWVYEGPSESPGDVKGGIDISADGSKIIASISGKAILFSNQSNKPLWIYKGSGNQAYNIAISSDGKYMAMGTAGNVSSSTDGYESSKDTNLLIFWSEKSEKPLWQYHTNGNFHDVSLSEHGDFITGATGCPDRRFYLFSKNSSEPIIRSEMLTRDSPVHRSKISADGQYAAVGSESDDGAVFLFSRDSSSPIWKYSMPGKSSARALNFTVDGRYIAAATFRGDVFIFDRDNGSTPLAHWQANTSFGGIDLAEDGSFVAAAGTDSRLHVFNQNPKKSFVIDFNEYVEEVDIAANNKFIAAGTGGSVYFFEALDFNKAANKCEQVIEPPAESVSNLLNNRSLGDYFPDQVSSNIEPAVIYFALGFFVSILSLLIYLILAKYRLSRVNQKLILVLAFVSLVFLGLVLIARFGDIKDESQTGCGNGICEPDFGETHANCQKDCDN